MNALAAQSDAQLVMRARAGDSAAFGTLVQRHSPMVHTIALAHLGNGDEAEDAAQDAFIAAHAHLQDCRRPERFAAWLLKIARNTALNRRKHLLRRRTVPLEHALDRPVAVESADHFLERQRYGERIAAALAQLKPIEREVLLLYDLDGLDHRTVAQMLGTTTFMSRRYVSSARRRMRDLLPGDIDE